MRPETQALHDWIVTTVAAIEEMTPPPRHLARSRDGQMIHRDSCIHARVPWLWPDEATTEQILAAIQAFGYHCCLQCKPDELLS